VWTNQVHSISFTVIHCYWDQFIWMLAQFAAIVSFIVGGVPQLVSYLLYWTRAVHTKKDLIKSIYDADS